MVIVDVQFTIMEFVPGHFYVQNQNFRVRGGGPDCVTGDATSSGWVDSYEVAAQIVQFLVSEIRPMPDHIRRHCRPSYWRRVTAYKGN
jgi:hypothetical protein